MHLVTDSIEQFRIRLLWLHGLTERLGGDNTRAIWNAVFANCPADDWQIRLLTEGWHPAPADQQHDWQALKQKAITDCFPTASEGISPADAEAMVLVSAPFSQILSGFDDLNMIKDISTYDALHLFWHDMARLVEEMIARHGKRGELMAYDLTLASELAEQPERMGAEEYLTGKYANFAKGYDNPTLFTAGVEREILEHSPKVLHWKVKQCEWARYFRHHHPTVGTLLSCSCDHGLYGSYNPRIRLQLTSTLMEGDCDCDFRLYAIDDKEADQ